MVIVLHHVSVGVLHTWDHRGLPGEPPRGVSAPDLVSASDLAAGMWAGVYIGRNRPSRVRDRGVAGAGGACIGCGLGFPWKYLGPLTLTRTSGTIAHEYEWHRVFTTLSMINYDYLTCVLVKYVRMCPTKQRPEARETINNTSTTTQYSNYC